VAPSFADIPDAEVERYVERYGEEYREVISRALAGVTQTPGYNPATFNYDRFVAAIVFLHSISPQ